MATLTYSFYKTGSYGASAGSDDPYFGYNTASYSGDIGQSTVSAITACKFTNANTNGSSANGYEMQVQVQLNGQWCVLGYITASFYASHTSWSNFTQTASAATLSLMGKYPPTDAQLKVTKGYFHFNSGSTLSVTATMDLDYLTSSLALNKTSCDAGTAITANISMNSGDLSHTFTWKFGGASFTSSAAAGETSHSVTIPAEWMNQIPNAASGTATVTMQTYAGATLIGATTASFTVTVPGGIVPTLATLSVAAVNPYNSLTLQNVSSAQAALSGASGQYGATISRVQITGNGETAAAYSLTTGVLKTAGNITFTAQVWDSRGRTASKTASIYVTGYAAPRITGTTEFRCDASGTAQRNGAYASCKASWVISTLTGATATLTIGYKRSSGTWSPDTGYTGQPDSGSIHVIGNGGLSVQYGWTIVYTVTDGIMTTTVTGRVPSIDRFLHFRPGGQGLGIGTMCEADQRVQINADWGLYIGDQNLMTLIAAAGSSGASVPIVTTQIDCDAVKSTGVYVNASWTNYPPSAADAQGVLFVLNYNGGWGDQFFYTPHNSAMWHRAYANNGFSAWVMYRDSSGLVPIESGGTGAATATAARSNLGVTLANLGAAASSHNHAAEDIQSGTLAAARLPFKFAYGSTNINGSSSISISYSSAGFTSVPKVFVTYSTTGSNWSGDNGAIKVHSKTTTGCSIVVGGSFSTSRAVDWFAIGT